MVSRPLPCDPERLRILLEDRLDDPEQEELAAHLEACPECRRTLDAMAAGTNWWSEARAFLAPEATVLEPKIDPAVADIGFLAPSEDPTHLGRIGPYEIVEVIGRGGMGVVLKGLDPLLNRFVAIKVLAPELATSANARRRFAREGQAAAAIGHDHIVAIHAVDVSGGLPYLVMQYVSGKSLQERIDRTGPLAIEEIVRIGMQTAQGLASAHKVGLIHRDIKPSNILLENCVERVKISDFGLARAVDDASLTRSGVVAGTPQYMSPEQARGEPVDHRTDLFSLGSVLYALCTGRPPFRADSTMAVLRRVSDQSPRPIRDLNPEIPDWLAAIVAKLHAKDPAERFQSAEELADLLGHCLVYLREPTRYPLPFPVARPRKPRRRFAIAGVVILAVLGLGAAEAAGVTQVVATILRIKTTGGTLVIKVDDPDVKVRIDGEEVVITGAGLQEVRLKPGVHTYQAVKGDRVGPTNFVEITRGGKATVAVAFEADVDKKLNPRVGLDGVPGSRDDARQREIAAVVENLSTQLVQSKQAERDRFGQAIRSVEDFQKQANEQRDAQKTSAGKAASAPPPTVRGSDPEITRLGLKREELTKRLASMRAMLKDQSAPELKAIEADLRKTETELLDRLTAAEAARPTEGITTFRPDGQTIGTTPSSQPFTYHGIPGQAVLIETAALELDATIRGGALSPDGKRLALVGDDGVIRIVDLARRRVWMNFKESEQAVSSVAFSTDSKALAATLNGPVGKGIGGRIQIWDLTTGRVKHATRPTDPLAWLGPVAISPDSNTVFAGSIDGKLRVWNPLSAGEVRTLSSHKGAITSLAFGPTGRMLVSASADGTMQSWSNADEGWLVLFNAQIGSLTSVAVAPDGRAIVAGGNGRITIYDSEVPGGRHLKTFSFDRTEVLSVAYSPDGKLIAAAGESRDNSIDVPQTGAARPELENVRQSLDIESRLEQLRRTRAVTAQQVEARAKRVDLVGRAQTPVTAMNDHAISSETYARLSQELTNTQIEIDKAEAKVAVLQKSGASTQDDPQKLKRIVDDLFQKDPKVVAIVEQQNKALERIDRLKRSVRDTQDPALVGVRKELNDATAALDRLWNEMEPILTAKIPPSTGPALALREAELKLAEMKVLQEKLTTRLDALKLRSRDKQDETARREQSSQEHTRLSEESRRLQATLAYAETGLERLRKATPSDPFFDNPVVVKAQAKLEDATREVADLRRKGSLPDGPRTEAAFALQKAAQAELDDLWAKLKPGRDPGVRQAFAIEQLQKVVEEFKRLQAVADVKMRTIAEQQQARFPGDPELQATIKAAQDQIDLEKTDREIATLEAERKSLRSIAERPVVGVIKVWDVATDLVRYNFTMPRGAFRFVAFTPDGKFLIAVSASGAVIVRDLTSIPAPNALRR